MKQNSSELARSASRGGMQALGGQLIRAAIQMATLIVLSRIISPHDFGLAMMVVALSAIGILIGDFGLTLAAAQSKTLTTDQRTNLFWLNTSFGLCIATVLFIAAPQIAQYYGEPEVENIAKAMAGIFLVNGMSAQFRASLIRRLEFGRITVVDISAQTVGLVVAIAMALSGGRYWAIVGSQVAIPTAALLMFVYFAKWMPGLPNRSESICSILGFGLGTMSTQALNAASSNANPIAIGRFLGPESVGLFTRGFQVFSIALQQLATPMTSVAVPILSRLRDNPVRFMQFAGRAQLILCYVLGIATCVVAVGGEPMVSLILGPQWAFAGRLAQILAIGGLFQILGYVNYWIFLALGRMRVLLACEGGARVLMIPLIFWATQFGLEYSAAAYSAGLMFVWLSSTLIGLPRVNVNPISLIKAGVRPLTICCTIYVLVAIFRDLVIDPRLGDLGTVAVTLTAVFVLVAIAAAIPAVRRDIKLILEAVGKGRPGSVKARSSSTGGSQG